MSTTLPPVTSNTSTNANKSTAAATAASAAMNLTPSDFLNMMVTQLQNQDPLNPTSSSDLLAQMSQIGQLQSSTSLQSTLQNFGLQTSLGSASAIMGKTVAGTDANSKPITGVVTSIQVQGGNVSLSLDSGGIMPLANVTGIAPGPTGSTTASTTTTPPAASTH